MLHVAIHDALNAIDRRSRPYAFDMQAEAGASPDAAVAAAARDVLVPLIGQLPLEITPQSCIDAGVASVEADYMAALAAIPDDQAKAQGIAVGKAAAAAILALRADDGAVEPTSVPFLNSNCPQDTNPGEYQCTPGTPFIAFERWESVTPFVLKDSSQFRPGPPYAVNKKKYTADFNEVKSLGGDDITTPSARTADQTEIALFWWGSSPLQWNRIARTVSADQGLDLWENARLFGLLNLALADGYIAMVDSKNHYNYWRPVTAIQTGDTDGNPDTTGDPAWTPLRPTPPDQDYASGHSIEGGAAAEVLKQFFGTDQISFQDCSVTLPAGSTCSDPSPVFRSYTSFSQAAAENAVFTYPRWVPLPQIGRRRDRLRSKNWQACRQSLPPACALSCARGLTIRAGVWMASLTKPSTLPADLDRAMVAPASAIVTRGGGWSLRQPRVSTCPLRLCPFERAGDFVGSCAGGDWRNTKIALMGWNPSNWRQ